jgi:cytochrome c oxidase cbb3-type subunit 3
MSSACERRTARARRAGAALAAVVALAACRQAAPDAPRRPGAAPAGDSPVGPVLNAPAAPPSPAREPPDASDETLAHGRRYFVHYNCAGCHGDHGGGGMGPSLRDAAWIYGGAEEDIADSIVEGRAHGMPAWRTMLTETQVGQITAYIRSLRTDREPDPPLP